MMLVVSRHKLLSLSSCVHSNQLCRSSGSKTSRNNSVLFCTTAMNNWNLTSLPLNIKSPVPSDIQIIHDHEPKKITQLAREIGLKDEDLLPYGHFVGKVILNPSLLNSNKRGKYVVVTGINPTPFGEGKSTTTIGLAQCLAAHPKVKRPTIATLRQPSQGPTFGIKGGAAGGGYSQVLPMEDFNLHLTGDIHAITAANNLIAAAIDARSYHEAQTKDDTVLFNRLVPKSTGFIDMQKIRLRKLGIEKDDPTTLTEQEKRRFARLDIDPESLNWARVLDVNDRFLRKVTVGQSQTENGMQRTTNFDISVASELMAILALCNDMKDARQRIGNIVIGYSKENPPQAITCNDLCITGAVTVLLKDAFKPNLVQTLEGTPVLVHAGPFANIAHGNSSVIADRLALGLVGQSGFVLTEAGFGADVGLEKFVNIKARASGIFPDAAVIVATVRALKTHGGPPFTPGAKLPKEYTGENLDLLSKGMSNLIHHIKTIKNVFGLKLVVAVNRFSSDSHAELELVKSESLKAGADGAAVCDNWALGGQGCLDLAKALIEAVEKPTTTICKPLYSLQDSIKSKIEQIVRHVYGGSGRVDYSEKAEEKIKTFTQLGFDKLAICIAKTQYSLTADASVKGAPTGFDSFPIVDIRASTGAGFLVPLAGAIQTMPGLPTRPAYFKIDINPDTNEIKGLF